MCVTHPEETHTIHTRKWGVIKAGQSGPALLFLPGTLGRGDIFWQQISSLKTKTRILALTYPDTGGIADWAQDITAILKAENMTDMCVLGSSLGGYISQYLTATQPDLFTRLIAANTLPDLSILAHFPPYNQDIDTIPDSDLMTGFTAKLGEMADINPDHSDLAALLLSEARGRIPIEQLRTRLKALQQGPELPKQTLNKQRIFTVESDDDALIPPPCAQHFANLLIRKNLMCSTMAPISPMSRSRTNTTVCWLKF